MKATYRTLDGIQDTISFKVIKPQPMQHGDGFILLGFDRWKDIEDEKLAYAVTNVAEFSIAKKPKKGKMGFHNEVKN